MSLELRSPTAQPLPPFTAGAHIDLKLTTDLIRSYSLSNDPAERDRYVLAVNNEPNSRGGSRHIHEKLCAGDLVKANSPRNLFELNEHAPHSVLIGGGIGITPLKAMLARLRTIGASWKLLYCTRSRETTAFLNEFEQIEKEQPDRIKFHIDNEVGCTPDLRKFVESEPKESHFYCCGPLPMLAAFENATSSLPRTCAHRILCRKQTFLRGQAGQNCPASFEGGDRPIAGSDDTRRSVRGRRRGAVLLLGRHMRILRSQST